MDLFAYFSVFVYRIRYKLIFGTAIAVLLAWYLSDFIPKYYRVTTTIFTGITSKSSVDDMSGRTDWNSANNAHENIMNIVKSKSVLEAVSVKLIAQHLMYGDAEKDNIKIISAANYRNLLKYAPQSVLDLVDKSNFDSTVARLIRYRNDDRGNFIYDMFNWDNRYYGYLDLSKIKVSRKGASDMIEISYESDDPGVVANTLAFLNIEIKNRYEILLLSASNDVVKHFMEELARARRKLDSSENVLKEFNMENNVINYDEQTKHLVSLDNIIQTRYAEIALQYSSSKALMEQLAVQMDVRTKMVTESGGFLEELARISKLNGQIAEIEIFGMGSNQNESLEAYKTELKKSQQKVVDITNKLEGYKYSKDGLVVTNLANEWLTALLNFEKSRAELTVIDAKKKEIDKQYETYSPVGPELGKQNRNVRVDEESYLTILHHLGLAKLKQKNILLDAGTLQVVSMPEVPLLSAPRKRHLYVIAAFLGAIVFITGFYMLIELIDKTLRDGMRATRLTKGKVVGAFPCGNERKYRVYADECIKVASSHLVNVLNSYMTPGKPFIMSLISIKSGEGKSYIAENLESYMSELGYTVSYLSIADIDVDAKDMMQATNLSDIPAINSKITGADVIIVEYPSLDTCGVSKSLLQESAANLLIMDAQRAWAQSDKFALDNLNEMIDKNTLLIYLNKAGRDAVESYTGHLPPYTFIRKLGYRLLNFGFTAKS